MTSARDFLQVAAEKVVVFDGAMGTQIQSYDLSVEDDYKGAEGCSEMLVLTRPDVIREIHARYFTAGADVVETDTFGANHAVLHEYDLADRTFEINEKAARLAREVASDFATSDRPRFVSGSIGPGQKLPSLGQIDFAALERSYTEQASGLIAGGADLFQIETCQDLLQTKAAIAGVSNAMAEAGRRLPVIVQVTIEATGTMLVGTEIGAALVALEPFDLVDVIGINCATGPREMVEHVRHLSTYSPKRISVLPNAGLPRLEGTTTVYDLTPADLVTWQTTFVDEMGVGVVGGCCGTTPEHIRALADALGNRPAPARAPEPWKPAVASLYSPVPLAQDTSFLVIGERANAQGSKKFRELLEADDVDGMVDVGREQVKEGAHLIDVCVDYTGRDGSVDMATLTARLATASTLPLVLDSTEWEVIGAGLAHIGGRAVINSVNLEDGPGGRPGRLFPLARKFGAAVICLCIDEDGQARDVDWKLRVAHRIAELAHEHGVRNEDLVFDALTFPLTTGQEELRRDGLHTLDAIRRIKEEIPGSFTALGVSNVSFGLNPAARQVLNSVFLHEAIENGLDAAIVNAKKILPLHRIEDEHRQICLDLIHDRRGTAGRGGTAGDDYDPLKALIAAFADATLQTASEDDLAGLPVDQRLRRRIVDGLRDGLTHDLEEALRTKPALEIVNEWLLDGMSTVGELFGSGQMQLPFVLESAETMKAAVAYLEPHMDRVGGQAKAKIVIATVKGDVHDIGKNLVDIILTNNGYEVHNLGIKQPLDPILAKAREVGADAIGMSGLLVKSTLVMRENLEELNMRGEAQEFPILLGGAALTRGYVERDLREVFEGSVFYCKDAFEGLDVVEKIVSGEHDEDWGRRPREPRETEVAPAERVAPAPGPARSDVAVDNPLTVPPFLGSRVTKGIPIDAVADWLNETALFRNQWRYVPGAMSSEEYAAQLEEEVRPELRALLAAVKAEQILQPALVYGWYEAAADGDDVVVFDPDAPGARREWKRLRFPRQPDERRLCISDFVRPLDSDDTDHIGLVVVTMGPRVSERTQELFEADRYSEYLHLHGLGVEMAEALMEYWHRRMREEIGVAEADKPDLASIFRQGYVGGRYSWGYPACPDLAEQATVAEILDPARIDVALSEEYMWEPEQTTAAIVLHHPEAKYFVVRDAATGKLLRT
ncbi:MAG: methionine synthase [Acidimicrobiia bacterium]|nr:methionine synthase [Acidimicrobiia bacterium]